MYARDYELTDEGHGHSTIKLTYPTHAAADIAVASLISEADADYYTTGKLQVSKISRWDKTVEITFDV